MLAFRGLPVLVLVTVALLAACEVANPAYDGVYATQRDAAGDDDTARREGNGGTGGSQAIVSDVMPGQGGGAGMPGDAAIAMDARLDQREDTNSPDVMPVALDANVPDALTTEAQKTIVMVGAGFLTMTSKDFGVTWSAMRGGPIGNSTTSYLGAGYAGGKYFAMGWQVMTSVDGLTWKASALPLQQYFNSVAYGDGTYMMTGGYGTILTSTTGDTWPGNRSHPMGSTVKCHSVAFGGGRFAVSNDDLTVYVTSDKGLTWIVLPLKAKYLDYCDGAFRAAHDCKTKTTVENLPKLGMGAFWNIRYQDGLYKSLDGTTWQRVYSFPVDVFPTDLTFGP